MSESEAIQRMLGFLPPDPPEVVVPAGDDCAVLRLGGGTWAVASDMMVEGHHFKGWASPEEVGYKAVAVNVSDVAAVGGLGRFILTSGGAPGIKTAERCFQGVMEACREFGVYPLGGDTTRADALTVDVSIIGELRHLPLLRSGARPGDLLAVTGELGASAAGFLALEEGLREPGRLVKKHLRPEPRVAAGEAAAGLGVHAAIDLSDGLASDVGHVCRGSGVGCNVDLGRLPVAEDTREFLSSRGHDPQTLAATGGEDYELLFAAPEAVVEELARSVDVPLTIMGECTETREVIFLIDGEPVELSGWDHFGQR